jgi:serine/threonine protein kinase/tetratricopeptide (TPR) repeat protein
LQHVLSDPSMQVSATTWSTLSELLDEALDLEPAARAVWMEQLSVTLPALAPSVRKLLEAHASSETADVLARLPTLSGAASAARVSALSPGDRIGPYRLKREIGAGGMADVWLAERADGAFTREVALKLPLINRLRRDLAQRFARERDILARLEHPHIARLYDAGVTDDGLPYLAMEHVDGESIVEYCDQRKLGIEARLQLFRQVLDAVQFAHANLIIHRDLKPTNILVTAEGQVRLLDFGIAKLLADNDTAHETQLTQLSGRALTPDYASPEQIKGEPLTIATDIYSLGVVLYELLAGCRPYRLKVKSAAQLEQAIVDAEPQQPSSAATVECAAARSATQPSLARMLAGDLDTIVLKTLAKLPADRYSTIAEFDQDLRNHATGLPVRAQPASWRYRARKFILRNRLAVGAAGTIAMILLAATAVSIWQARVAMQQTTVAQRESKRAQAVQRFLLDLFRTNTDAQADPVRARETTARELLDIGAARVTQQLNDVPEVQDEVLATLSDMYRAVGLDDRMEEMERRRVETRRQMYGATDPRVAETLIDLARSRQATTQRQQISSLLTEAKALVDARADTPEYVRSTLLVELARLDTYVAITRMRDHAHEAARLIQLPNARRDELSTAWRLEGRANYWLGHWDAAIELHQRSIAEERKHEPEGFSLVLSNVVELAEVHARQGDVPAAERLYRDILDESTRRNGEMHVDTVHVETRLANFLHETSRRTEARRLREATLKKLEQGKSGDTPNLVGQIQRNTASGLYNEGQFEAASHWMAADLELRRRLYPSSTTLATALLSQGLLLLDIGHYDEAAALLAEAASTQRTALGSDAQLMAQARFVLAQARMSIAVGRAQEAIEPLRRLESTSVPKSVVIPLDHVRSQVTLAAAYLQQNQVDNALGAARSALKQLQHSPMRDYYQSLEADASLQLGRAELRAGDFRAAHANLERSLSLRMANDHSNSPWISEAQIALAECLVALGSETQARSLVRRAAAIQASHTELGEHYKRPLTDIRRRLGMTAGV